MLQTLPFATTLMNPEDIMLSEMTQKEKKNCMINLYVKSKQHRIYRSRNENSGYQGWGGEGNGNMFVKRNKVAVI